MSAGRVNPFAETDTAPSFSLKARASRTPEPASIDELSETHNFPSRRAANPEQEMPPRRSRVHLTGRNQQLNFKATEETIRRFYDLADRHGLPLCRLLEQALEALEISKDGETF